MELRHPALEHGTTRGGRWLRARRVKLALGIAVAEGFLVVFDVVSVWVALAVATALIGFYFTVGRTSRSDTVRHASWVGALSQVLVALIPVLVVVVGALALLAIVVLAAVALFVLLADRR